MSPAPPPSKRHRSSVEHPHVPHSSRLVGAIISQQRPAATCALPASSLHAPQGRASGAAAAGGWSRNRSQARNPAPRERCRRYCAPQPSASRPTSRRYPRAGCSHRPSRRAARTTPMPSQPSDGNWDAGSALSCPPAAPESRCSWLRQPSHQRQPLHGEARGRELFFQRPAGRPGPAAPLGRCLLQGKGEGRTPPSARHGAGPTAHPSAGLLFQPEATTSKTEDWR